MALILSIGFVVDDAIVMLENIVRHIEHGETPLEAALKGSQEIGFTILTMTTSLAAVFIPILFMSGILGRLFREFAVTITTAILISGVVSVTLTPMLCSRFLRRRAHARRGFAGLMDRAFERAARAATSGASALVLRHRVAMLVRVRRRAGRRRCRCSASSRRASSPIRTTTRCSSTCRRRRARRTTTWSKWTQQVARHRRSRTRTSTRSWSASAAAGGGGDEQRPHQRAADAARAARPCTAQQIAQQLAAAAAALPRLPRRSSACRRRCRSAAAWATELQPHDAEPRTPTSCTTGRRSSRRRSRAAAGGAGRLDRHGDEEPARQPGDRSRQGGGASA